MDQTTARQRAKELGGVAVGARISPQTGRWVVGGWPNQKEEQWIVVNMERTAVLDDGTTHYPDLPERGLDWA